MIRRSSADIDLCQVISISMPLFMVEVPYLCINFTITAKFLTSSTLALGVEPFLWCEGRGPGWLPWAPHIAYLTVSIYSAPCQWHTPTWQQKENVFRYCHMSIRRQNCLLFIIMELKESFYKKKNSGFFKIGFTSCEGLPVSSYLCLLCH